MTAVQQSLAAIRSYWTALERDWQSVAVGAVIVVLTVVFEIQIPW
ncbi:MULTISPECIES: hypothetical protein [Natronorubrum]|uniref:Uncharacterized protein n=1 Tax=Natronorubrum bangense JCM 10635 TaxID=1227500 RepID=L9WPJ3_9EURY|nr:hypothetical protein [Natronorubrum bangense]ELY51405.1 hypothetical protein C494_03645 [Natronorubrum bangense JCM 10635]